MAISPWAASARATSPDGSVTARIEHAAEVAMGGPTAGQLRLSNGIELDSCNPSIVWSEDSRYLAVPQWSAGRTQRLVVIDVPQRTSRSFPPHFRVLELHTFAGGRIEGIDSPAHLPARITLNVRDIFEPDDQGPPMATAIFDRDAQLAEYAAALRELATFMRATGAYALHLGWVSSALEECEQVRLDPFSQDDLNRLGGSFPQFVKGEKNWMPPLLETADGRWVVPEWFPELERRYDRAASAAFALRVIGDA